MRSLAKNSQQLKRGLGRDEGVEVVVVVVVGLYVWAAGESRWS